MLRRSHGYRLLASIIATALLLLANATNVLAEGVRASEVGLYAGLPGLGGRLVTPDAGRTTPLQGAAQRVLITTAENIGALETGWQASARAAIALDPGGRAAPQPPDYAVVLIDTHAEGRVHTVHVHPDDLDTCLPHHPGPTHQQA